MKKLALLFSLILIAESAHAFIDTRYMKDAKFLANTGYSAEMARIVDISADNPYREPYSEANENIARRIYQYLVPGQNGDLDFYNHSGHFNGWSWRDY